MPQPLTVPDADKLALSLFEGAGLFPGTPSGATWLARDTATGTSVAVRRLAPNAAKARVTVALNLSHPNIVRTRRWFSTGGHTYTVRDVIRGRNLKTQLAGFDGRYGAELLEKLLLPVLSALEAAHGAGVVHGGVSAENVLISDDGRVCVADFAVVDSSSKHHAPVYAGAATVANDIKAAGKLLTRYLPTGGAFASDAVRARVAGIINRCDSVGDLRETLAVLDKLASAPVPVAASRTGAPPVVAAPVWVGPPPLPDDDAEGSTVPNETRSVTIDEPATNPENWVRTKPVAAPVEPAPPKPGAARLSYRMTEAGGIRVISGGGAPATLILTNDGDVTLTVRGVATQRPWLQVRPMELPVRLPGGASVPLDFAVSARSLSVGEYKSEIYLSADADGANAADLRGGWFKHTAELRVIVVANGVAASPNEKPPYPSNAPTIPAPPGCAVLFVAGAGILTSGLAWGLRLLNL